ncbi:MAG: hypothetical protein JW884_01595 [Deltaproteobacteria bacterium]|nr:hypothetical protein [Deltaproteobacteria bacterium]
MTPRKECSGTENVVVRIVGSERIKETLTILSDNRVKIMGRELYHH